MVAPPPPPDPQPLPDSTNVMIMAWLFTIIYGGAMIYIFYKKSQAGTQ